MKNSQSITRDDDVRLAIAKSATYHNSVIAHKEKNIKMIYTVHKAKLISEQMRKFSDADSWIIVGQFSNLDFWLNEVKSALKAIDEHNMRFDKTYESQKIFIDSHKVEIPDNCPICQGICELGSGVSKPSLPQRSPETKSDKKVTRTELINSTYYFLRRCYNQNLLNKVGFRNKCDEIGTSVDINDLKE